MHPHKLAYTILVGHLVDERLTNTKLKDDLLRNSRAEGYDLPPIAMW